MYAPARKIKLIWSWPLISLAARSLIIIIIILKKSLKWVNNFTQVQSNQNRDSVVPEQLLAFHHLGVIKVLYDIMGVAVKHFIHWSVWPTSLLIVNCYFLQYSPWPLRSIAKIWQWHIPEIAFWRKRNLFSLGVHIKL